MKSSCQLTTNLTDKIVTAADMCVRCGLCLPHCPTYQITQNESESPRGRIAIAKAFAETKIPFTKRLNEHLDHCLACGNCESMCPAKVPYHQLLVNTRELIQSQHPRPLPFFINTIVKYPKLAKYIKFLMNIYNRLGLSALFKKSKLLSPLPQTSQKLTWKNYYSPSGNKQGDVALFLGCINNLIDTDTITAAITLLTEIGFGVYIPKQQQCCGAIHLHHGDADEARHFDQINQQVFNSLSINTVITLASGCGKTLKEFMSHSANIKVLDIHTFLNNTNWPEQFNHVEINKRILIHTPCTLKNGMHQAEGFHKLLKRFGCKTLFLSQIKTCCGAAGLHMLQYPDQSNVLTDLLYQEILTLKPDIIVTANIGCLLQIKGFLDKKDQKIPITHPITLIFQAKTQKNLE